MRGSYRFIQAKIVSLWPLNPSVALTDARRVDPTHVTSALVILDHDLGRDPDPRLRTLPLDQLPLLSHERLDVYQISIRFLALCQRIIASTPRGYGDLIDQLRRAAVSVPLNIAEASGRTGAADNARHFAIARGSALESGAIMDALRALGILDEKTFLEAKRFLVSIVSMLSKLCMKK